MGVKKQSLRRLKTWFGNFSYTSKYMRNGEEHFTNVHMLKAFDGVVHCLDSDGILEVKPGMMFERCTYHSGTKELNFYIDDEDTPPVTAAKCNCCNAIASVDREESPEGSPVLRRRTIRSRVVIPEGSAEGAAASGGIGETGGVVASVAASVAVDG